MDRPPPSAREPGSRTTASTSCATATRPQPGSRSAPTFEPAAGGRSVWVKSFVGGHHCTLREIDLAGLRLASARGPCRARPRWSHPALARCRWRAVPSPTPPAAGRCCAPAACGRSPATSRSRFGAPLASADPDRPAHRHAPRTCDWPSRTGGPQAGADEAAVGPEREADRAELLRPRVPRPLAAQVTDVWLLDPGTGRWRHLPGTPAAVALKFTSMSWTSDGRLVMLAQTPASGPASPRRHRRLAPRPERPRDPVRAHTAPRQRQRQLHSLGASGHVTAGFMIVATLRGYLPKTGHDHGFTAGGAG